MSVKEGSLELLWLIDEVPVVCQMVCLVTAGMCQALCPLATVRCGKLSDPLVHM